MTITGTGTVVDGGHLDRVFDHHAGAVTLRTLHVRGSGDPGYGGGAIRSAAPLTVRSLIVTANDVGGIVANGPLTISTSSITDNRGDGIQTFGPATIDRVTTARNDGTGMDVWGATTIARSTSSGNGVFAVQVSGLDASSTTITASTLVGSGEFTLFIDHTRRASIVATAITNTDPANLLCANTLVSASSSRMTDATCLAPGAGNAVVPTLGLGPLAANGGPTATHLPSATSALLDVVAPGVGSCTAAYAVDQRGLARPSGPACDVGAVERQP